MISKNKIIFIRPSVQLKNKFAIIILFIVRSPSATKKVSAVALVVIAYVIWLLSIIFFA